MPLRSRELRLYTSTLCYSSIRINKLCETIPCLKTCRHRRASHWMSDSPNNPHLYCIQGVLESQGSREVPRYRITTLGPPEQTTRPSRKVR
ncbi:hypothetical protein PISMIDRAFT_272033 [Pisolithus microcarpus 441]|uniref:Uncharacterized protein n=1 Tax=Pisolithus microcarpus 441 TaxID=765257 RepID=A0A0C9ZVQ9_9AGAM|nr:hypothetical protein PISMIDRAFT_272033 [Pisolithus microcarpus 441]